MNKIAITTTTPSLLKKAKNLAKKLNLSLLDPQKLNEQISFLLNVTPNHLELKENNQKNTKPIVVDFLSSKLDYRIKHSSKKNELIAKACGIKNNYHPYIIDATAGFGIDAFILASLGSKVTMLERSTIIGALLKDGLERLKGSKTNEHLKISLVATESSAYLNKIIKENLKRPDVIYLDPIYPQKTKSSLNKKSMRILKEIVGQDQDASELLAVALRCAKKRVVVKRPKYANHLGNLKPNLKLLSTRNSRYDIYFIDLGSDPP